MGHLIGRGRTARETYPTNPRVGASGAITPLSRQKFIDGDTTQAGLNGSVAAPFKTIAQFMSSRGNASINDATANYVGWVTPSIAGYAEAVAFPAYASTELRADSRSISLGVNVVGNVTWANVGGAFVGAPASVAMHNISVTGDFTVTDDVGAGSSFIIFGGDEIGIQGAGISGIFNSGTTTKLTAVFFTNALVVGGITAGTSADSASVSIVNSDILGSITAGNFESFDSVLGVSAIDVGIFGTAAFFNTQFLGATTPLLTAPSGSTFDGTSWRSFLSAGGLRAVGTVVLVQGGYNGGPVEGKNLPTTGVNTDVSLNGTGASAGYTGRDSGNHYTVTGLNADGGTVTLKTGGGEKVGDTILISKNDSAAHNFAVLNGGTGAGTLASIPGGSQGFVLAQFDGTNWVFVEGGVI